MRLELPTHVLPESTSELDPSRHLFVQSITGHARGAHRSGRLLPVRGPTEVVHRLFITWAANLHVSRGETGGLA
jgi:hypothetical protein